MENLFERPSGTIGRFAIVKLWPDIKTAEDECIARLKIASHAIGIECIEVNADGGLLSQPDKKITKSDVDFVLHLHYDTPKRYDAFSIVALWNPLKFYHEWGYERCSRNLTTHDDFVSCSSQAADDHVARMIRSMDTHLPTHFHLYHSTADVIHSPSLGDQKLFYAGINWEAISGGKSRHQEVLKRLDTTGFLRIYGPTIFSGVQVWAGYESYVREVPFDGISMIDEISKAGIALVLSSQAHKESELMSNRLFESVAAGALVICDENPFGKRFFGDSLLYIDSRSSVEQIHADIMHHLDWVRQNPGSALAMIAKAQQIFREKFTLIRNLSDLYLGLARRKQQLIDRQNPPGTTRPRIQLNLLMPEYSESVLQAHLKSITSQEYREFLPVLVVDKNIAEKARIEINAALANLPILVKRLELDFFKYGIHPESQSRRRLGEVINELLDASLSAEAFMVVAPNETLLSNHLAVLAGTLQREPETNVAATAAVLVDGTAPVHSIHEIIDFGHFNHKGPCGFGRFIFRISALPKDIDIALPYLDGRPLAVLVGKNTIAQQLPATISIDIKAAFPAEKFDEAAESAVIRNFNPDAFKIAAGVRVVYAPTSSPMQTLESAPTYHGVMGRLFNWQWIMAQINALRKHGLNARIQALKHKLG